MAAAGGAPQGNENSAKGKEFHQALKRALCRQTNKTDYREALDEVAAQLVKAALKGEQWAVQEIANREDGKPTQSTELTTPPGNPLKVEAWVLEPVKPDGRSRKGR